MHTRQAVREATALLELHGLYRQGWRVVLDNARRRAGQCNYRERVIKLSRYLTEARTPEQVRDTVLHEIAHALTPGHGHDGVWQRKCLSIGGNGQRCHDTELPGRYVGTCPNNHKTYRHRMSKAIRIGSSCGKCSGGVGGYQARYALTWVDTGVVYR